MNMLQVGQVIKPDTNKEFVEQLVERLYGLKVILIKELNSYDDRNYFIKVDESFIKNSHIKTISKNGYTLKILNSFDSNKFHYMVELEIQKILNGNLQSGVQCPLPILNVHGSEWSKELLDPNTNDVFNVVRFFNYIPGYVLHDGDYTKKLLFDCGHLCGDIHLCLNEYNNPHLTNYETIWDLKNLPDIINFMTAIKEENKRQLVLSVIDKFKINVIKNFSKFRKGVIHGDLNEQNILINDTSPNASITGVIDYGDNCYSYLLFDLSNLITYLMIDNKIEPILDVAGHVLSGYIKRYENHTNKFSKNEFKALKSCIEGRYCQSLVMGEYTYSLHQENDYVKVTGTNGWKQLNEFVKISDYQFEDNCKNIILSNNVNKKESFNELFD